MVGFFEMVWGQWALMVAVGGWVSQGLCPLPPPPAQSPSGLALNGSKLKKDISHLRMSGKFLQ
jgi:hypothetical protein